MITLDNKTITQSKETVIDSFEGLEDYFSQQKYKPNPKFTLANDRTFKISSLADFFKTKDDVFTVFYEKELNN